jgi:cytochrome c oxidase cbb3-type subunit 3
MVLLMLLGAVAVTAAQVEDGGNVEPALAREAVMLIQTRCGLCHTTDLIVQQRLPEDRWAATVEKMVSWGAALSNDEKTVLLQFLTTQYRPDAPPSLPSIEHESASTGDRQR